MPPLLMQADPGPLVSVLLPFHNVADTIGDCIDSILAQTLADFEVIAVNDFSDDDSLQYNRCLEIIIKAFFKSTVKCSLIIVLTVLSILI